jgi:hypothetical protein
MQRKQTEVLKIFEKESIPIAPGTPTMSPISGNTSKETNQLLVDKFNKILL